MDCVTVKFFEDIMKPYWMRSSSSNKTTSPVESAGESGSSTRQSTPIGENMQFIRPMSIFQRGSSRAHSLPTINLAVSNAEFGLSDYNSMEQQPSSGLDLAQIPGPSRPTLSMPDYSHHLLNTLQFNNASSIFSLPYLALPPMNFPDSRRQVKCAICDEIATGRHYGAASCFGCKSFWRRSIYCQRKYRCKFEGKCELKKAPHQNLCRACRLRKCFEVGMNPEGKVSTAIQLEREQSVPSQLDLLEFDQPLLPIQRITTIAQLVRNPLQLVQHHEQVCQRVDEHHPLLSMISADLSSSSSGSSESQVKTVPFENAFFNPTLLCSRTKLNPSGTRVAAVNDIIEDSKRCFVLYSDWLQPLAEFQNLSKEDQIILSKRRFSIFHWWICSLWTIETKRNVFCYSNGSYFPLDSNAQCIYDSYNMIEKMFKLFIEPLRMLNLTIVEYCLLFSIALFHSEPLLSPIGQQHIKKCYDNFVKLLYEFILESKRSSISLLNEALQNQTNFEAAKRMSDIIGMINTLHACTCLNSNNEGSLPDVLHIVDN